MATSNELIMIFIGLEISSIATYILAGYLRDDKRNNESALKYFLLGSFATAFLLYGVAWIYGITGSTNLVEIRRVLTDGQVELDVAGRCIRRADVRRIRLQDLRRAVPDVGSGRLSGRARSGCGVHVGRSESRGLRDLHPRLHDAFEPISSRWEADGLGLRAADDDRRQLRRAHAKQYQAAAGLQFDCARRIRAGGGDRAQPDRHAAAMFYLASYAFMNIGAFAVVTHFARQGERYLEVDQMAGLAYRQPMTAAMMVIFLLSLIGVPLTAGFFGKFYVFKAALDANLVWLTVLGLLNSAVAAYYYLRIIVVMYMHEPTSTTDGLQPLSAGLKTALLASAVATVLLGVFPSLVLDFAGSSATLVK